MIVKVLICSISFLSFVQAALIKGVVTDTMTKAPAESVLVKVQGTSTQTYTNAAGKFSLDVSTGVMFPEAFSSGDRAIGEAMFAGAKVTVTGADGSLIFSTSEGNPAPLMSRLPDGVYIFAVQYNGHISAGRMIKMGNRSRTLWHAIGNKSDLNTGRLSKTAATATIVFTHKYYNTKQGTATVGDTNVAMKLRMWFPTVATTGPTNPSLMTKTLNNPTISTNGTVLENVQITGTLTINASNVTVRNFKISTVNFFCFEANGTNIVLQDGELDGLGTCGEASRGSFTARRLYVHHMGGDAFKAGSNTIIEDCYITDIGDAPGAHADGVQSMGGTGILILHNNFNLNTNSISSSIFPGGGTQVYKLVVDRNRLNGGGWCIYANTETTVTRNQFGRAIVYGAYTGQPGIWQWNVWEDTGASIK
jgi:hypothetical protein